MARKNKKELVEKVAEETKVEAVDLDRLPVEAIEKLDAIVPDQEETATIKFPNGSTIQIHTKPCERKKLKGHHPITKEPVYL
jgi:nucleoid DNA-binding protein